MQYARTALCISFNKTHLGEDPMKFALKLTLSVVSVAALLACSKKEEAPAAKPAAPAAAPAAAAPAGDMAIVKIAHVGPTSGGIAHLGKDNELGAKMAIEDLNAKGLSLGGKKVKFELMAEDDAGDPKQGTAVAQKIVDSKVNGIIGHLNSGTSIPASKIYSDAGIPQISPSATNPKFTRQGFKTTFRVVADDVHLGGTLGKYAVQSIKGKSIAVIDDRTAYGQGVAEEFKKAVEAAGGKTMAHEFTTDKATDFMSILTSIKAKKPDVIFYGGMDAVAGPMLKQIKQLGMTVKFMGGDGICSSELVKLAGDGMADDQVVCAEAGGVEGEQKAGMDDFRAKFKAKNNIEVQVYAPYVYDAVNVMAAAMVKADSADPAKYLPELAKTEGYKGVTGTISFDEKGDVKNGALTLYTYKGGKREQIAVVR
jgi:branched-chain amino acid transport system substrate-binding protein